MGTAPLRVLETYNRIAKENKGYISLKLIRGKYYVYRQSSRYDKQTKKIKPIMNYIGRILDNGKFIEKYENNNPSESVTSIKTQINNYELNNNSAVHKLDNIDIKILQELSTDARIGIKKLANKVNISQGKISRRLKYLEKEFEIEYILEVNTERLGYSGYVVLVKFDSMVPKVANARIALENEPYIQFAAMLNENYMIIYMLAENSSELTTAISKIRDLSPFFNCKSEWYISPIFEGYGFIPLRDVFLKFIENKVWHRTKESLRPNKNQILYREYKTLTVLNKNSRSDFNYLDKINNFTDGTTYYTFRKLLDKKIIIRTTINMALFNSRNLIINEFKINNEYKFAKSQIELFKIIVREDTNPVNRFSYVIDIKIPDGLILFNVLLGTNVISIKEEFEKILDGVSINTFVVTDVLVGNICNRKYNNKLTNQYKLIEESKNYHI